MAKLIVHAENRHFALNRLRFALEETVILGVGSNQCYLRTLLDDARVQEAQVHTRFLESEWASFSYVPSQEDLELLLAAREFGVKQTRSKSMRSENLSPASPWVLFGKK